MRFVCVPTYSYTVFGTVQTQPNTTGYRGVLARHQAPFRVFEVLRVYYTYPDVSACIWRSTKLTMKRAQTQRNAAKHCIPNIVFRVFECIQLYTRVSHTVGIHEIQPNTA